MGPAILIVESRPEVAEALQDVVGSANYVTIVRPYLDRLCDLGLTPAAIVVRISSEGVSEPSHGWIERLTERRPPIVAIARGETEVREAQRLGCEVILRAPEDVGQLCDALSRVVN